MKRSIKAKRGAKHDLFAELSEGMQALADARQGKRTLRTHAVEYKPSGSHTAATHTVKSPQSSSGSQILNVI